MPYDPKRSRPAVHVSDDDPAPVDELVVADDAASSVTEAPPSVTEPAVVQDLTPPVSAPFEPAGPPDRRMVKVVAIGVATASALALMVAWRRRRG